MQNNINSNDCIKGKISLSKKFQKVILITLILWCILLCKIQYAYIIPIYILFLSVIKFKKLVCWQQIVVIFGINLLFLLSFLFFWYYPNAYQEF